MRQRIVIATVIVLALAAVIPAVRSVRGAGFAHQSAAVAGEEADAKKKGNGFVRALKAPFKAIGRLFGGGGKDDKSARVTEEDIRKFQTVGVVRVNDARTALPPAAAPQPQEEARSPQNGAASPQQNDALLEAQRRARENLNEGRALLSKNYLNEAIARLSSAATFDPTLADAHRFLGVAYDLKGLPDMARASYERALKRAPRDAATLTDYGYFLYLRGDNKGAVKQLKRAVKAAPTSARAWNNLALAQCRLEKFDDAYKSFARAGGEFKGHLNVANAMERAGRDRNAIEHYEAARRLDPASSVVLQHLADIHQRTGNVVEAEAARQALAASAKPTVVAAGN